MGPPPTNLVPSTTLASMSPSRLPVDAYTIGWVCALPLELAAASQVLDEEHEDPPYDEHDANIYTLGRIGDHNVVIACLPAGQVGNNPAVAMQMRLRFPSVRIGLLVSIGGGVPSNRADIRLGDVVVSQPDGQHGGVVQFDRGKTEAEAANHLRQRIKFTDFLKVFDTLPIFRRVTEDDVLFEPTYNHQGGLTCAECDTRWLAGRPPRTRDHIAIHYGTIASGNQVTKDALARDRCSEELGGVLCFEMEAAGLMSTFPCLVIRGICDYADSHKNKKWQPYAAAVSATYAKEVLTVIPVADISQTQPVNALGSQGI
ncbi:nucleoside phosphorylase domain-containing protein [Dactylonectria macrodidyma]|uniref:Nucleoside phosphorylase domain-containing protein n=1 Tax=Dactylonectria macrodidyma TaxID=307937 RepID=A0A9P9ES07_9HYPO|nr:nucleoside phosphorylase domain-containing protein [Dactylonectria macrodidyma]